jgi:hypothetical protein
MVTTGTPHAVGLMVVHQVANIGAGRMVLGIVFVELFSKLVLL